MALLSEYGFNEGSGTSTADSSGNGYNLTSSGSPWTSSGHTGNATTGTGGDFGGRVAPNASQTAWTVMCWAKFTTAPGGNWYAVVVDADTGSVFFEANGANGSAFFTCNGVDTAHNLSAGVWYHIAITRTQAYVNGVASGSSTSGSAVNWGPNANFRVGRGAGDADFDGVIDDLRIFSDTLDAATITTWMNTPVGGSAPALQDLILPARTWVAAGRW